MKEWNRYIQTIVDLIDEHIKAGDDEKMTLSALSEKLGYSECYVSRMFRDIAGIGLKDYLRGRRLSFALKELRSSEESILSIALNHGFSSNESFTRAFQKAFGITPSSYRKRPIPVVLQTIVKPFDCYLMGEEPKTMNQKKNENDVKAYFVKIPAHKFLHIRNLESKGYWDFWQKQAAIPGQDCQTICGLLDSIKGKLDDQGGNEENAGSGQLMAWINDPKGRVYRWNIPLAEAYGVRLPADYQGEVPSQMQLMDVLEGEYIVFEHGPFDFETEGQAVEAAVEKAMEEFDYAENGYELDTTPERMFYFFHDPKRYFKYVRPVTKKVQKSC
ncbi:MAG: helix-turn-helix transcriptional regulator [Candidatus Enteromonas sp.]